MNPSRRNLLMSAGGAGLALLGAGAAFAATRTPHRALAPWQVSPADDVRLHAFRHAILAPNPHNRQPWLITLIGKDEALIHCDLDRRLPVTDPFDRQITIGFGCFLELARIAAAERGVSLAIREFPEGMPDASGRLDGRPIAHLKFAGERRGPPVQGHCDPALGEGAVRHQPAGAACGHRDTGGVRLGPRPCRRNGRHGAGAGPARAHMDRVDGGGEYTRGVQGERRPDAHRQGRDRGKSRRHCARRPRSKRWRSRGFCRASRC